MKKSISCKLFHEKKSIKEEEQKNVSYQGTYSLYVRVCFLIFAGEKIARTH